MLSVVGVRIGDRRALIFTIKREYEIAIKYCKTRDISVLVDELRSSKNISFEMRHFIADILEGKPLFILFKSKARRKPDYDRNIDIALEVHEKRKLIPHLRSNQSEAGAVTEVAEKYGLDEDAVVKIYSQLNKAIDLDKTSSLGVVYFKK
jgi:hypothetical protein